MAKNFTRDQILSIGQLLQDDSRPMKQRYRALFALKNIGGKDAIECISKGFSDSSALLKHECAYCLGQMQDAMAISTLIQVLENVNEDPIVRHEAGEALGAIGVNSKEVIAVLKKYLQDPILELSETCELALKRLEWLHSDTNKREAITENPYFSVDPAPPCAEDSVHILKQTLLDEKLPLFQRYRAMFSLRNIGDSASVLALAEGLKCNSALFRHEIAYVLGQMQHPACVTQLIENLKDLQEHPMVRHECAEALGSIATEESMTVLQDYLKDSERVVKESCEVALDICEYEMSNQFQWAKGDL
ncbi:deoxyhypusine hydroxylase [Lingula anatina]|uniref:Deoxyhypusine hydroxylase n=1 Tax=Lingula anatina TaxID=7574 RepID=A0A1S3HDQ4_LINAN|nr:deoxyhypusine hydroxylase [Lingula anatina]|eukprot:XP_013383224.1 deoxyhypusine hydroxylase [Lingula anatina]